MKIKNVLCIVLIIIFISGIPLFAKEKAEKKAPNKMGFIFRFDSLTVPLDNYSDGVIAGFGYKYWLNDAMALRALVYLNHFDNSESDSTTTNFGAGAAFEYHFTKGKVSPHVGALGGIATITTEETITDFYLGGLVGVEIEFLPYLSGFAEYGLYAIFREIGMELDLASKYRPAIGIILYF